MTGIRRIRSSCYERQRHHHTRAAGPQEPFKSDYRELLEAVRSRVRDVRGVILSRRRR